MSWTIADCRVAYHEHWSDTSDKGWFITEPFGRRLSDYGCFDSREAAEAALARFVAAREQADEQRRELRRGS